MKKNRIFVLTLIVSLLLLALITGCSKLYKTEEPKTGMYIMQGAKFELQSWVLLEEDNKFQFNRHAATSYLPTGTYSINGNKLTLNVNENESYSFSIEADTLIFESSTTVDALVEKGTVYKLSADIEAETPNALPPSIMVEGELFYYTSEKVPN